jgi:anti-anti-sigma factor
LFRRYAKDIAGFGSAIAAQWWQTRPRSGARPPAIHTLPAVSCSSCRRIEAPSQFDAATIRSTAPVWETLDGRHCLFDLAGVRFIDSTGLAHLMRLHQQLRSAGRHLVLLAPSPTVQRALKFMGWSDFLASAPDAVEARRIIQERGEEPAAISTAGAQPLAWRGEITVANVEAVRQLTESQLAALSSPDGRLIIDLDGVRFIDSAAVGAMIRVREAAERHGANLSFVGATPGVRNVLRLANVEDLLLEKSA